MIFFLLLQVALRFFNSSLRFFNLISSKIFEITPTSHQNVNLSSRVRQLPFTCKSYETWMMINFWKIKGNVADKEECNLLLDILVNSNLQLILYNHKCTDVIPTGISRDGDYYVTLSNRSHFDFLFSLELSAGLSTLVMSRIHFLSKW